MRFVWPPITAALDERAKIADGLSAADKAKADLAGQQAVEQQLAAARNDAAKRPADAERLAQQMIEEAKACRRRRRQDHRRRPCRRPSR